MMAIRPIRAALLSGCAAAILLTGVSCGPRLDPDKVPVQVKVNYKGTAVAEAVVIFVSEDGRYANGLTGSDGVAHMGTSQPGDGVFPGQYQAAVDKSQLIEESDPSDPTGMKVLRSEAIYHVPARYSDFAKSGLSVDVTKHEPAEIVFELQDK